MFHPFNRAFNIQMFQNLLHGCIQRYSIKYFCRYCGFEISNDNEKTSRDCSLKSPDTPRKASTLTITSRAAFAFSQSSLKKPKINHEPIRTGEPYGPHDIMARNSKEKLCAKSDGEVEMNSENDSPRRRGASLDVPHKRSKFKASR